MNEIRVDPEVVIRKLTAMLAEMTRKNAFLEAYVESIQEKQELSQVITTDSFEPETASQVGAPQGFRNGSQ
jgi:hypothetical protein